VQESLRSPNTLVPRVEGVPKLVAAENVWESEWIMKTTRSIVGTAFGIAVLALSSCSGSDDGSGVASLDDPGANPTANPTTAADAEAQALAFAQCMRDNGVDFPDPTVNADGVPTFEGAFGRSQSGGFDPGDTSFNDAMDACSSLMQNIAFGGGPGGPGGNFDASAIEDAMLPYTDCLREQGLDVGDFTMQRPTTIGDGTGGAAPTVSPSSGSGPVGPGPGEQGGGFDRTDMFAQMLGQDPTDPAWIAANEICGSLAEDAFGAQGGGIVVNVDGGEG
jgi:hypothetical protein